MTSVAPSSDPGQPPPIKRIDSSDQARDTIRNVANNNDDAAVPRVLLPRKSAQRTNSSSSISSTSSTSSVNSSGSTAPSTNPSTGSDDAAVRKKPPTRSIFPTTKAEPSAALSLPRTQSAPPTTGPSAISAISQALSGPSPASQQNGNTKNSPIPSDGLAVLHLLPMNGTFEHKIISVPIGPEVVRIGRQTNQKTVPTPNNGYFDSKVLSRQHAEVWADREGRVWIRDVKSSNGTFVNGKRLSPENKDSEPHILKEADVLELGIDIVSEDQKTVVHHKVAARVEHAGLNGSPANVTELTFGDMDPFDPALRQMGQPSLQAGRGRAGSQGANGMAGRFPNIVTNGAAMQTGYHPKWIQPITIEAIVKRINTELKAARLQANDLKHTASFVDAVVANEKPPLPLPPARPTSSSPRKSFDGFGRNHISAPPPGPPPTQPLPEAPPAASMNGSMRAKLAEIQPLIRRDTEKPSPASVKAQSPVKTAGEKMQIRNLVDALTTAQREISSQGEKLKEMEEALVKERGDRQTAEERALHLTSSNGHMGASESASRSAADDDEDMSDTASIASTATEVPDASASATTAQVARLQSLIKTMQHEMDSLRTQLAAANNRADEAEESSRHDRKSLIEMVESIKRREERSRQRREARRRAKAQAVPGDGASSLDEKTHRRQGSASSDEDAFLDFDDAEHDDDIQLNGTLESAIERLQREGHHFDFPLSPSSTKATNGSIVPSVAQLQALGKSALDTLLPSSTPSSSSSSNSSSTSPTRTQPSSATSASEHSAAPSEDSNAAYSAEQNAASGKPSGKITTRHRSASLTQEAAPYASLIGVVLLGVGMMAWLNGWQKIER